MFPFEELCGRPVAAADYIGLCKIFHTLVLKGVPIFNAANRNEAYRCAPPSESPLLGTGSVMRCWEELPFMDLLHP